MNRGALEEELEHLADRAGCDAATLGDRFESESNLPCEPVVRQKDPDVSEEAVSFRLSDAELYPLTWREQRCFLHLGEERQGLSFGHG
jgi:hypothetical protein